MTKKTHKKKLSAEEKKEQLMDEGLQAIYGDGKVDFSTIETTKHPVTKFLISLVVILGVLAGVAWSGFFVYTRYVEPTNQEFLTIDIDVEEQLTSGQEATIIASYRNPSHTPLASLEIDLNIPSTFVITSFNQPPNDQDQLIWSLGSLAGNADGEIVIEGVWIADVPSEIPLQAYATYRPSNFNADFEAIALEYVTTTDSLLALDISGEEETTAGDDITYTINVTNESANTLDAATVSLTLPNGFYLQQSEPTLASGSVAAWELVDLLPNEPQVITITGSFAADVEGFQYLDVTTSVAPEGRDLVQATAQTFTDILQNDLSIQLAVGGATEQTTIDLGETLRVSFSVENTSDTTVDDATLLLDFQSEESLAIDWNNASLDGGTITRDGIYWSSAATGALDPGVRRIFNLQFPVDSSLAVGDGDNFTLLASMTHAERTVRSTPIDVGINTEATLTSAVRYFDDSGAVLGSGPVPPQVGQATSYRVYWTIENSVHDLENVRVRAELPPTITWQGTTDTDLGNLNFDATTNTVTWSIDRLSATVPRVTAYITVTTTPEEDDVDTFVKLLGASKLQAIDKKTQATLDRQTDGVTTEAPSDAFLAEKGIVVE
jgi:uncharacterized repeat protein (TIGR01451 family)